MSKRQAVRNMLVAGILIAVILIGAVAALSSTHLILTLPR